MEEETEKGTENKDDRRRVTYTYISTDDCQLLSCLVSVLLNDKTSCTLSQRMMVNEEEQ